VLNAAASGQFVDFVVDVPTAGTFSINASVIKGVSNGIFQLFVDGEPQGSAIDLYGSGNSSAQTVFLGNHAFLAPGHAHFRFCVEGRNRLSTGYSLPLLSISLQQAHMFTLVAPNGSCWRGSDPLLVWHPEADTDHYVVLVDGERAAKVGATATSYQTKDLAIGPHTWSVAAVDKQNVSTLSNTLSFVIGDPPPFLDRDCDDSSTNWKAGTKVRAAGASGAHLWATVEDGTGSRYMRDVALGLGEGEVSTDVTPANGGGFAGVQFVSDDGTRVVAVIDTVRHELRIERWIKGYSIFAVTSKQYWVKQWAERSVGDAYVWEIASRGVTVSPTQSYHLSLAFSRRSCAVMAKLSGGDIARPVVIRDLVDTNAPCHPGLVGCGSGARFAGIHYRRLNKGVYKWDIDTNRIVLRPGGPGTWDCAGAFNPAVVVKDNLWYMVYRGNAVPAPPNAPPASQLGEATSMDGIHWIKSPHNPLVKRVGNGDSVEDPDMLVPARTNQFYLEYNHHQQLGEVLRSGSNLEDLSDPWPLPTKGLQSGKVSGIIDTENAQAIPHIVHDGISYRYVALIEEGTTILSNDLHNWERAGTADFLGKPDQWCSDHECGGDMFVDHDGNIRVESQAGTDGGIVGNRKCTIMEDVLSGSDPTKVLMHSDLPFLPDWYGNAPTGDLNENTFTNGSVFPGQTIINGGYLWHYYGGNNTFTGLIKCKYGPEFVCRNLMVSSVPSGAKEALSGTVEVRNVGSLPGVATVAIEIDGKQSGVINVRLKPDASVVDSFRLSASQGAHVVSVQQLSAAVR
jgi:hypothetical protein